MTAGLKLLARKEGVTLFMVLLAGYQLMLSRWSGQQDVVVGTPVANRSRRELEDLIGFFVNMLVLRVDLRGIGSVGELLSRVREVCLGGYAHQDLPFERLVEELNPARELNRTPLFQTTLVLQNAPVSAIDLPGLRLERAGEGSGHARFDLELIVEEAEGVLVGGLTYAQDLFSGGTAERMVEHWKRLLEGMAEGSWRSVDELEMLSSEEREQVLEGWNRTERAYGAGECVHGLFEQQVERSPLSVALVSGEQELSYGELNRRANQLGHYLQELGVGPEVRVGLCVERSVEMVVGLLGILKAGGVYVPLDPSYPTERLGYMLEDTAAPVLLTQARLSGLFPFYEGRLVQLDEDWAGISSRSPVNVPITVTGQNAVYVIYTSGSTGTPKGVIVSHESLCNRLAWMESVYEIERTDRVLQKTSIGFDVSVWEFLWPLSEGAVLFVAPVGVQREPGILSKVIRESSISILHFVPSMLSSVLQGGFLENSNNIRHVICSGESLSPAVAEEFYRQCSGCRLHNLYGPTEAAIDVTFWECSADSSGSVPIGRPIGNARMYVLDGEMRPVPVGVRGELYIGGAGVARGYLNRADLTAERFVPDPFHGRGERLYRSGDVGYWRWDGNLEYVGRADQQVKVRGYRIEPGEIEGVLREQAGVRDAVVLAREDTPGDKRLVGYVVGEEAPGGKELRRLLGERLPEYMVPGIYVHLASLPLTGNGKLDRSALPAPGSERDSGEEYVAPRNVLEELLCSIWSEVLKLDRVGVEDNFFELGGHSLLATQVVSQVRQVFGVELALREMFEWPTVGGLSVVLEQAQGVAGVSDQPALQRVREREHLPLSYAQQRLWFIEQLEGRSSTYNIPLSVRLLGELDAAALEHALTEVVRRHEVLRTRYVVGADGSSEQVIEPYREQHLERVSLAGLSAERVAELAAEEGSRAFDLAVGPMLRARLLELGERSMCFF